MKQVDALWLVEHTAREMDVACAVKAIAERQYDLNIAVRNIYYHAAENMAAFEPSIVVYPFFYFLTGALATEDYVKRWPNAVHFNLAWEEIHYKAHLKIKAPADDFTKKKVLHHAWGPFYKDYLMGYGVPEENIFLNGQPAYQLYLPPYVHYYRSRDWLAKTYNLDPKSRWVFVPENYRWAFIGNKIELFSKLGGDREEILSLRDFSLKSLKVLLQWCNSTAENEDVTIIFRPRPATNSKIMDDFVAEQIGAVCPNLRFIKEESVREWILASDVVISSYSTSLIESAIAGKPTYMVEPYPIPDGLQYDWYRFTPHLYDLKDFQRACLQGNPEDSDPLRVWAETEMLARGDPIRGLADYLNQIRNGISQRPPNVHKLFTNPFIAKVNSQKKYFNPATHENDVFTPTDVESRVANWQAILDNDFGGAK
jgi:surface carbohydrate biosynthesis protein